MATFVEVNNILSESQFGFRKGYSTVDAVYTLAGLANIHKKMGKKLYCCYVNLTAAFDMVNREKVFHKLHNSGFSTKVTNLIRELYKDTNMRICDGTKLSRNFWVNRGVKQGCILSPLLFALFMNDVEESLKGGADFSPKERKENVNVIMYADDLALVADTSDSMKMMINRLFEYMDRNDLKINMQKTKIMIFNIGRGRLARTDRFFRERKEIERVTKFKYLGINMNQNLSWEGHIKERCTQAKKDISATWGSIMRNKNISEAVKIGVFEAAVNSITLYGAWKK